MTSLKSAVVTSFWHFVTFYAVFMSHVTCQKMTWNMTISHICNTGDSGPIRVLCHSFMTNDSPRPLRISLLMMRCQAIYKILAQVKYCACFRSLSETDSHWVATLCTAIQLVGNDLHFPISTSSEHLIWPDKLQINLAITKIYGTIQPSRICYKATILV